MKTIYELALVDVKIIREIAGGIISERRINSGSSEKERVTRIKPAGYWNK